MIEEPVARQSKLIPNLLVLITVIGFALTGWLAGHILRHSIPAYQFQHPPIEEIDPKIKNGFELEGIRRQALLVGYPAVRVILGEGSRTLGEALFQECAGTPITHPCPRRAVPQMGSWYRREHPQLQRVIIPSGE